MYATIILVIVRQTIHRHCATAKSFPQSSQPEPTLHIPIPEFHCNFIDTEAASPDKKGDQRIVEN